MNKKEVIKKLGEVTNLSEEKCIIINDISEKLETTREESENIYELAMSIIGSGIKDKLKHPFC